MVYLVGIIVLMFTPAVAWHTYRDRATSTPMRVWNGTILGIGTTLAILFAISTAAGFTLAVLRVV